MKKLLIAISTGCPSLQCAGETFGAELIVPATYLDGDSIRLEELRKQIASANGCTIIREVVDTPIKIKVEGVGEKSPEPPKDYGHELAELTKAVLALVRLQSVLNEAVKKAIGGSPTFEVL